MSQRPVSAMATNETEMMQHARQLLESGEITDPIEKIRQFCLTGGTNGVLGLGRAFRRMEETGNKHLNLAEFIKGMHDTGLPITDEDGEKIFRL